MQVLVLRTRPWSHSNPLQVLHPLRPRSGVIIQLIRQTATYEIVNHLTDSSFQRHSWSLNSSDTTCTIWPLLCRTRRMPICGSKPSSENIRAARNVRGRTGTNYWGTLMRSPISQVPCSKVVLALRDPDEWWCRRRRPLCLRYTSPLATLLGRNSSVRGTACANWGLTGYLREISHAMAGKRSWSLWPLHRVVPANSLLERHPRMDGSLCTFLDKPVSSTSVPRPNEAEIFKSWGCLWGEHLRASWRRLQCIVLILQRLCYSLWPPWASVAVLILLHVRFGFDLYTVW